MSLFPGCLLLKDMVTLVISLKVSLFFLMVGIELRTPHSVKILYSLASKCCSPLTVTVGHGLQHEVT